MIVADTNLIVSMVLKVPTALLARSVFALDPTWIAPPLWRYEFKNVLVTQMRVTGLPIDYAISAFEEAESILASDPIDCDAATVLRLASQHRLTAYDSEYLALALLLGIRLVTFDTKLSKAAPGITCSPEEFLQSARP